MKDANATTSATIEIDLYTGRWQEALRPTAPPIGTLVYWPESHDARERDDFKRCLRKAGLDLEWSEGDDWEVVKAPAGDD